MTANRPSAGLFLLTLAVGSAASAQELPDTGAALAQSLFDEGVALMEKEDYVGACPKLAESQRLDPAGGTLLNLGLCRERAGNFAAAWLAYNDVLGQAIKEGRKDRELTAKQRIEGLAGRVSRLVVTVSAAAARQDDLVIAIDGAVLRPPAWGLPSPIDQGEHFLAISARGKVSRTQRLVIVGEGTTEHAVVEALESVPVAVPPRSDPYRAARARAGFVVGGAGIALVGVGVVTGLMAVERVSASDAACPSGRCTQRGVDLSEQAGTFAIVSNVSLALGVASLVAGAVLVVVLPKGPSAAAWMAPNLTNTSAGVLVGSAF